MFSRINNYRAERARKKMLEQGLKKSKFRKWRFFAISLVVIAMSSLVYAICFAYKAPVIAPLFSSRNAAPIQIVSPFDFQYESEIQTQAKRDLSAERIPPLYKVNAENAENAAKTLNNVVAVLDDFQDDYDALSPEAKKAQKFYDDLSSQIRRDTLAAVSPDDIRTIFERTTKDARNKAFKQAFFNARNIMRDGIYADSDAVFSAPADSITARADITGAITPMRTRAVSESVARKELLEKIKGMGVNESLALAVYRLTNQLMRPNIEFDEAQTKLRRDEARRMVPPVVVKVIKGETLADSSMEKSPVVAERIKAYRAELDKRGSSDSFFISYIEYIYSLLLVISGALFIVISKTLKNKQPRTVGIFCTLLLLNLSLERLFVEMSSGEYFDTNTPLLQIFAYVTPIMLGPIIQVLLFGSYTGFIMALIVAALTTLMLGQSVMYFVLFMTSALIAIYFCDGASSRPQVVFGGIIYGLFIAFISFTIGMFMDTPLHIVWRQSLLAIGGGALTGLVSLAVLPVVERIFNRYSNITLLDYTDFNNPILRRLQLEAPGTYHHSVMVSYLSEAAAVAVNANAMVCRVGALYHDIGKIQRPEFFSENQGGGKNAHDEQNPSMSALIIKNHTREGAEIAKIAKLPKQIMDAIEQHHGTSIIAYFYNKALKLAERGEIKDPMQALRDAGIDESTYRHEGRKPQTVENAIIMIADSCEAASRSLKRITKHGVDELVTSIVHSKMTDGQLNECPITVKQLAKIKDSIVFTMLNMLHSRVAYNNDKK